MGMLDTLRGISQEPHNKLTILMGKPGSGKTTVSGTFPKPMLYVAIDTDGVWFSCSRAVSSILRTKRFSRLVSSEINCK